jgi:acyl carrier protein
LYEALKKILVEDLQMRAEDVTPAAGLVEVGLDSLAAVELSSLLVSALDVQIYDYELRELATVGDVARLMAERHPATSAESGGPPATATAPALGPTRRSLEPHTHATPASGPRWHRDSPAG